jgi:hypothetical protein
MSNTENIEEEDKIDEWILPVEPLNIWIWDEVFNLILHPYKRKDDTYNIEYRILPVTIKSMYASDSEPTKFWFRVWKGFLNCAIWDLFLTEQDAKLEAQRRIGEIEINLLENIIEETNPLFIPTLPDGMVAN